MGEPGPVPDVRGHSLFVVDARQDRLTEPAKFVPVAGKAMDIASQIIREQLPAVVSAKGDRDMVSDIDVEIERAVRGLLARREP